MLHVHCKMLLSVCFFVYNLHWSKKGLAKFLKAKFKFVLFVERFHVLHIFIQYTMVENLVYKLLKKN